MRSRLVDSVKAHEGFRADAYQDSVGVWTIGYGTNLQQLVINKGLADNWMRVELDRIASRLLEIPSFRQCDEVRQDVLIEMCYQLGVAGCRRFKRMWAAIELQDWEAAADEMLDSKWAREQTPSRARTLAGRMRAGVWEDDV